MDIYEVILGLCLAIFIASIFIPTLSGCTEGEKKSIEISKKADNFENTRVLTVINTRNDKIIFRLVGTFSCQYSGGDLDIICAIGEDKYEKHFIHLNENLTYIVEDTSNTTGDLYHTVIEYYPES